jgi:hypothetical protein
MPAFALLVQLLSERGERDLLICLRNSCRSDEVRSALQLRVEAYSVVVASTWIATM